MRRDMCYFTALKSSYLCFDLITINIDIKLKENTQLNMNKGGVVLNIWMSRRGSIKPTATAAYKSYPEIFSITWNKRLEVTTLNSNYYCWLLSRSTPDSVQINEIYFSLNNFVSNRKDMKTKVSAWCSWNLKSTENIHSRYICCIARADYEYSRPLHINGFCNIKLIH